MRKLSHISPQESLRFLLPPRCLVQVTLHDYVPNDPVFKLEGSNGSIPIIQERTREKYHLAGYQALEILKGVKADVKIRKLDESEKLNDDPPPPPRDASDHLLAKIRERAMRDRGAVGRETFQSDTPSRYELDDDAPERFEEDIVQAAKERTIERERKRREAAEAAKRPTPPPQDHSDVGASDPGSSDGDQGKRAD